MPIAEVLAGEIVEYREECRKKGKDVSPDAFMFPGRFGKPMDTGNFRKRVLHRLADDLGLPKLTFQVIRRTIATLGKSKAHPKDIQGMLRHSRLATTMEVYMQSLEPEVRRAINSIHDELMATGTHGPETTPPSGTQGTGQSISSKEGFATGESQRTEKGEETQKVPSRCKIIPFAGKMRANDFEAFR